MKKIIIALALLISTQAHADSEVASAAVDSIKSLIPYLCISSPVEVRDCKGPRGANYFRSEHPVNGVSICLSSESIVNDSKSACFYLGKADGAYGETLEKFVQPSTNVISAVVRNKVYDHPMFKYNPEFSALNVKLIRTNSDGTIERRISVESYNSTLGFKTNSTRIECTVTY
jgi:hypothetical protein